MAPNKCCETFSVSWFGQAHYSITASKKNVVVFFKFEYAEFSGYVRFFRFRPQIPFLGKFRPKYQNCRFILKFGAWINLIRIFRSQWRCSIFMIFIGITLFGQICSN